MLKPFKKAALSFELLREIGHEGKNSEVFVAQDNQLDAELVIKRIKKADFSHPDEYFDEARILYLSNHSNIVPVYYACESKKYIYIAMRYMEKGSLNVLINTRFLTVREIVRYSCQFLMGVHNIHSKGLIHFDIKPDNILISDRDEALLSDFGLAKHTGYNGIAGQDKFYGKQAPPESIRGCEFTRAFDIYQIGITLYRMCNGNRAFYEQLDAFGDVHRFDRDGFRFAIRNGRFPNRDVFPEHIPARLKSVVKRCLEINPNDRFESTIDIVNELAEINDTDLDWQYEEDDGFRRWTKEIDGKAYWLEIDDDGNSIAKKRSVSGRESRITSHCINGIGYRSIRSFLGEY